MAHQSQDLVLPLSRWLVLPATLGTNPRGRLSQEEFKEDGSPGGEAGHYRTQEGQRHLDLQASSPSGKSEVQKGQDSPNKRHLWDCNLSGLPPSRVFPTKPGARESWSPPQAPLPRGLTLHVAHVSVGAAGA